MFSGLERCARKLMGVSFGWQVELHRLELAPGAAQLREWKEARVSHVRAWTEDVGTGGCTAARAGGPGTDQMSAHKQRRMSRLRLPIRVHLRPFVVQRLFPR